METQTSFHRFLPNMLKITKALTELYQGCLPFAEWTRRVEMQTFRL